MTLTSVFAAAYSAFFCKMTHFQFLIVQEVNTWFVGDTWHLPSSAPLQPPHHTASSLMFSLLRIRSGRWLHNSYAYRTGGAFYCSAVKSGRLYKICQVGKKRTPKKNKHRPTQKREQIKERHGDATLLAGSCKRADKRHMTLTAVFAFVTAAASGTFPKKSFCLAFSNCTIKSVG